MKSLRWMTIFALVAGVSMLTACGSDDNGDGNSTAGTGGSSAAGTGGSATGGSATGGSATGGSATGGSATGGSATGGSATGGSATGGSATGGSATGGSAQGGSAQGGAGGAASCNAMAKDECLGCCATAYPAEWDKYQKTYAAPCVCQDDADGKKYCKTECGSTLCATTPATPDDACQACMNPALNVGGSCFSATGDCMKDTECGPVVTCMMGCK